MRRLANVCALSRSEKKALLDWLAADADPDAVNLSGTTRPNGGRQ
jgi:hypothetical protein